MGLLNLVGNETKRYTHESGDWIDLRAKISKGTMNAIIEGMPQSMVDAAFTGADRPQGTITFAETNRTTETLFNTLVVAWSAPEEPSLENYLNLDNEAAGWVDKTLYEHFNSLSLGKEESGKL